MGCAGLLCRHLLFRLDAPELETLLGDRLLNRTAWKIVRRRFVGPDHASRVPGPVLLRQLASFRIARECTQFALGIGLEHEDTHCVHLSCLVTKLTTRSAASELLARWRTARHGGTLVLVAEYQAALFQVIRRHFDGDAVA